MIQCESCFTEYDASHMPGFEEDEVRNAAQFDGWDFGFFTQCPKCKTLADKEAKEYDEKEKMVEIPKEEYESLKSRAVELSYLEQWGVDNWSGYGEAMNQMREEESEK